MRGAGFTALIVTPYFRTSQTAVHFCEGAGDWNCPRQKIEPRWTEDEKAFARWTELIVALKTQDIDLIAGTDPDFVASEADRCGTVLRDAVLSHPEGSHILIVCHSPLTEVSIEGVTGKRLAARRRRRRCRCRGRFGPRFRLRNRARVG